VGGVTKVNPAVATDQRSLDRNKWLLLLYSNNLKNGDKSIFKNGAPDTVNDN